MKLLLDTHIALWAIADDRRLSQQAKSLILEPANVLFVSVVSLWEIAIKHQRHPQDMPLSAIQAQEYFLAAGYALMPVLPQHILALESLENHHQDPFDRLLLAQSVCEPAYLLTHDKTLSAYHAFVMAV
jgi:PIN domain nuclease of toxin-antitoxin system